ncbi:6-hydroxymethylpterin diphosphokinase MptE-like protein [Campylobacter coli]
MFILNDLLNKYGVLFEFLIVEQDIVPFLKEKLVGYCKENSNVKYHFLYNPYEFNLNWGKNVAARYFSGAKTIVFYDFDFIVKDNFVEEIYLCNQEKCKVSSPFGYIYYLDKMNSYNFKKQSNLQNISLLKKTNFLKSIVDGLCIFNRNFFLEINGFNQHMPFDIENKISNLILKYICKESEIRISDETYFCLWKPQKYELQNNFGFTFLKEKYGNSYFESRKLFNNICLNDCKINEEQVAKYSSLKKQFFGDADLYRFEKRNLCQYFFQKQAKTNDFYCKNLEYGESLYQISFNDIYKINNFRNVFKRKKRCFIIGNGPSLNKHDLFLLKNEITFGFNSIFYKKNEFKPNFYIVEDSLVMKERLREIENYEVQYKFFPINYKELLKPSQNQFFFKMNLGFYQGTSRYFRIPRFSLDATEELFCGQSVTYIALQLAYFMGFEEVYLIGMDFHYIIPESHKRVGSTLVSDTDDPNHFHKDYFGKGKSWHDPKLHEVAKNYKMAKLIYESSGRKIYNATIGGKLEIFDRVDYYSIFKKSNIPNTGAVEQVKKHLSYKLGKAIIHDTKQFKNIINFPFRIFRIVKEHNKDKNNIGKNLREYSDYPEAVKIQQYFSYRLGKCIVSNYKNPFLLYKLIKIVIEYKRRK